MSLGDSLLNTLLGAPNVEGVRVHARPDQYRNIPYAWEVTKGPSGVELVPKKMPGGVAGLVIRNPGATAALLGAYLYMKSQGAEDASTKARLLGMSGGPSIGPFDADPGVF